MLQIFHKKSSKGFTLIELLVVIAIIGVLASIVLASLNTARKKGRDAKRVADIKNTQTALELYFDACAQYPASLVLTAANGCTGGETLGTFIPAIPSGPLTAEAYTYFAVGTTSYHLAADLEETTPAALDSDSDGCAATGTGCSRVIASTTINGDDVDGCDGTTTTRYCYDVTP